ncbi:MAG: DUF4157 domain-containing protein [Myxococcota bacterium]
MSRSPAPGAASRSSQGSDPKRSVHASTESGSSSSVVQRNDVGSSDYSGQGGHGLHDSLPLSSDALATGHFQDVLGNGLLLDAIAGNDVAGFGGLVAGEVATSMAGIETGGFGSNTAMARALRDAISPEAGQVLSDLRLGGGHPIPALHKTRMERAFGHDFGHVRLHTDTKAAQAAEAISAYAFAIGSDIFFGTGTFALGSTQGDRLLAHELTHVVQHDEGRIPVVGSDQDKVSSPSDPLEREAYGNEVHILSVLQQVDAQLRAETTGNTDKEAAPQALEASESATDFEEDTELDVSTSHTEELATDAAGHADAELESALDAAAGSIDLGGFTADAPADSPSDADDAVEGSAMRDASGVAKADKSSAQQHIKKSRGTPISADLASRLTAVLGHDVSGAVLHTDSAAAQAADALDAHAFALGADVFFAEGAFAPGTTQGDALLAHELTHVVQHAEGRLPSTGGELEVSSPSDSLEREASKAGEDAARTLQTVDTQALSWGEPASPEVIADRVSLAMGLSNGPVGDTGLSELDTLALNLGAGAFAPELTGGEVTATNLNVEDTGLALREANVEAQGSGASADEGTALPETLTFLIAGIELILDAKRWIDELPKEVEIPINNEPLPGLRLTTAKLSLDESGIPTEGSIKADLKIGDLVTEGGLELKVDQDFNVTAEAQDVTLSIADSFEAVASVTLSNSDLTASVTAQITKEMSVGEKVKVTHASLEGTYAESKLHLEGAVTMRFGDWVEGTLEATYDTETSADGVDTDLDGSAQGKGEDAGPSQGGTDAAPTGGDASRPQGDQGPEGEEEGAETASADGGEQEASSGESEEDSGSLEGKPEPMPLSLPGGGQWNATGTLTQIQDLTRGDVTLTDSSLTVKVENNVMDTVDAKATVLAPHLEGKVEGQLSVPNEALHGHGTITLTEAFRLEEMGVTIDSLDAKVEVKANKLESIKGALSATVDYEDQPTFKVDGEELSYVYADEKFSGTGTVTLLRDLTFGDEAGTHIKVLKDASAEAVLKDSDVDKINAGLKFEVNDKTGMLGDGEVHLEKSGGEGAAGWAGKGNFALTTDYGVPEREEGPLFLKEESTLNLTFAESAPETAELENVQFLLKQQGDEASGQVEGKVEGTYSFETDKVSGNASAAVTSEWPVEVPFGTFTLNEGGKVDIEVKDSDYETIKLNVPYTADVEVGTKFTIKGEAVGEIAGETDQYTGKISGNLVDDLIVPIGKDGSKVSLLQDASVDAEIENNELKQLDFDAHVQYFDAKSELFLDGTIDKATYTVGEEGGKLDAEGKLTLMQDIVGKSESGELQGKIMSGTTVDVIVQASELTEVGVEGKFEIWDKSLLLEGAVTGGKIDLSGEEPKVSGRADLKTARDLDFPRKSEGAADEAETGTKFSLKVLTGSGVGGDLEENELTKLDGDMNFQVAESEGGTLAEGHLKGEWLVDEDKFTGDGELKLTRDYPLKEGVAGDGRLEGWSINLRKDSGVMANMVDNKMQEADVNVDVDFKEGAKLMAEGNIHGNYTLGQSEGYSGSAGVKLVETIDWAEDSTFSYHLTPPTEVKAEAVDSSLTSAKGTFIIEAKAEGVPKIKLTADTTYEPGSGISGTADIKVLDDMKIADRDPWEVFLQKGSGGNATVKSDELTELSGTLKLGVNKDSVPTLKGEFNTTYTLADGADATVTASGEAELLQDLGGSAGEDGNKYYIESGSKASADLEDGALTKMTGDISARVDDADGHFIKAKANGSYATDGEESVISVTGTAKVSRDKTLVDKAYKIDLVNESSATVEVTENQLNKISGGVKLLVSDDKGEFALGELEGSWLREGGTSGEVSGKLLREIEMGTKGEYKFFVEKGSGGNAKLDADELVSVGGQIDVRVDDEGGAFLFGTLKGNYKLKGGDGFTGSGSMEVKREKQLGELAGEKLFVEPGTGAQVTIQDNAIKTFGGNVNLSLRDGKGEYVDVKFDGTYDVGSKAFSGGGGAKVTREKKLFGDDGGYSFWLKPSDSFGAEAYVDKNKLTKVGGSVPFMVKDGDPKPLIVGEASGTYAPETGKFDGSGEVFLGRDVEYSLGSGKLVFKEGSGGQGEVVASKLEKLGGTLEVEVHDAAGLLLSVKAEGEFDAVKSKILWVEGSATLERPMEPLGKNVMVIDSLTGSARVENNELKWAEGTGSFTLPALNNMKGEITARYENRDGADIYTGKGSLEFNLFNDPGTGRKMDGKIDAELMEGGKFRVKGTADYQLSEMIGGSVGVEMDESFDPVINASMEVKQELIPGQDLFRMNMDLLPHTEVPIYGPIVLGFGASGGMGLAMLPLNLATTIGIENWRPLGEGNTVPTFTAELAMDWGLNLDAMVAAYLTLGISVGVGSVGAGVQGEARLDAPLTIEVGGSLRGEGGQFTGELGIGVKLEPSVSLAAIPFVMAQLTGLDPFKHPFESIEADLGTIFSVEWGSTYTFGDVTKTEDGPTSPRDAGSSKAAPAVEHKSAPTMPAESLGTPTSAAGGPQLESGSDIAGGSGADRASEGGSEMDQLTERIDQVTILAKGLAAVAELLGILIDLLTALITAGPVGLVFVLIYKIATRAISWDGLVTAVENVIEAVTLAAELIRPHLPAWLTSVMDFFSGSKPSLIDALFGADNRIRDEVNAGSYNDFPNDALGAEMTASWIDTMLDGVCGNADENCILTLLRFAEGRGQLHSVVAQVDGGASRLEDKINWSENKQLKEIFRRNGIDW